MSKCQDQVTDGQHLQMDSTYGWTALTDGQRLRMDCTYGWRALTDGQHLRMESAYSNCFRLQRIDVL